MSDQEPPPAYTPPNEAEIKRAQSALEYRCMLIIAGLRNRGQSKEEIRHGLLLKGDILIKAILELEGHNIDQISRQLYLVMLVSCNERVP
jgi:hypothetical protein